jgi:hypothetical protein
MRTKHMTALGGLAMLIACSQLKTNPTLVTDAGVASDAEAPPEDAGITPLADATMSTDSASIEDGPIDSICGLQNDAWTDATPSNVACKKRRSFLIEAWNGPQATLGARSLSIARSPTGRIAIAFNGETGFEEGFLGIRVFASPIAGAPTPITPLKLGNGVLGENIGAAVRIAAGDGTDEDFHFIYQADISLGGGDILYRRIPPALPLMFGTAEKVASSVGSGTTLALAVSPTTRDVLVSYFKPPATNISGTLETRLRSSVTKTFSAPIVLQPNFSQNGVEGKAEGTLHYDTGGSASAAYMLSDGQFSATPQYAALAGGTWGSSRKTLDNSLRNGIAGRTIGLVKRSDENIATYFFVPGGSSKASLRSARWTLDTDTPVIEDIMQAISADDPTTPRYSARSAIDRFGLLHIVYAYPEAPTTCAIGYLRQQRVSGSLKWLDDGVAGNLNCTEITSVQVAMVVDATTARPHIAYSVSGVGLFYATRFDR